MTRPIQQLSSEESLLLAYVAGELDGDELAELTRRMDADAMLPPRMRHLQKDYAAVMDQLQLLDQGRADNEEAALRRVDRLLTDWRIDKHSKRVLEPVQHWHIPGWSYAAAAAVLLLVGFCFWWANNTPQDNSVAIVSTPTTMPTGEGPLASETAEPLTPEQMPLAFQNLDDDNTTDLSDLEHDVVALSQEGLSANNFTSNNSQ